jgi:hypothetical protein
MENIRIEIAGREYPLSIQSSEVTNVKAAADKVSAQVEVFRKQFSVEDRIDLLAMTALQFATQTNANAPTDFSPNSGLNPHQSKRANHLLERLNHVLDA